MLFMRKKRELRPGDIVRESSNYSSGVDGTYVFIRRVNQQVVLFPLAELMNGLLRTPVPAMEAFLSVIGHVDLNEFIFAHIEKPDGGANETVQGV